MNKTLNRQAKIKKSDIILFSDIDENEINETKNEAGLLYK